MFVPSVSTVKPWLRTCMLVLVPLVALGCWLWLQPAGQMSLPHDNRYYRFSVLYDEFDWTAMALRGLNAFRGRLAGYPEPPADEKDETFLEKLATAPPLQERYFLEYPHAALLLFRAGWWFQPEFERQTITAGILDADYHNVAMFEPTTAEEKQIWGGFVAASWFYVIVMVLCLLALIVVLERGYGPGTNLAGGSLLLLLPATLFFTLNRYDIIPALCTALSFAFLGRKKHGMSAFAMGIGVLFKVYPILFVPLILRFLWSDRRAALHWFSALAATGLLALTPLLFGADLKAIVAPYAYQFSREPEFGLTIYRFLLPEAFAVGAVGSLFRVGTLGAATVLLLIQPITSIASILRRGALLLLVFVSLAVFYSPQWILWFAPLLLPLVGQVRRIGWTTAVLDAITYLTFPLWFWLAAPLGYWFLMQNGEWNVYFYWITGGILRFARFAVCAVLFYQLARLEWPRLLQHIQRARHRLPALVTILTRRSV